MAYIDKITNEILGALRPRSSEIVRCRFGLGAEEPQTLEAIAQPLGITRERVRQIQEDSLSELRPLAIHNKNLAKIIVLAKKNLSQSFGAGHYYDTAHDVISKVDPGRINDGLVRKTVFLLRLVPEAIFYHPEDDYHYHFFAVSRDHAEEVKKRTKKILAFFENEPVIHKSRVLDALEDIFLERKASAEAVLRFLRILKTLDENPYNEIGLRDHPRINPKNTRERIYVVLLKHGQPMHFRELADQLNQLPGLASTASRDGVTGREFLNRAWQKAVHHQTVHNDLIRDPRFVLIGRGIYALKEWNYEPGTVKDVLIDILKEKRRLSADELVKEALRQRQVKPATVLINLHDKKTFVKKSDGNYTLL